MMTTVMSKYAYMPVKPTIKSMAPQCRHLTGEDTDAWFGEFWEAFERELCVYSPTADAKQTFAWAYERSSLVGAVSEAFLRYPLQAFKADRLSKLLLATASDDLKHGLFAAYVRMLGMHEFKPIDVYEFKDGQHYQPFEKVGSMDVFSYFLHRKANPFHEHLYLMDSTLKGLDLGDLKKLIDLLEEKIFVSRSYGVEDQPNFQAILVAIQSQHPEADVMTLALDHWKKTGDAYRHSSKSFIPNAWETIERVIVETGSQDLFDNAAAYLSKIPGMELTVDNILEIGLDIASIDHSSDDCCNQFTIAKSLGKKILLANTQNAILNWNGDLYSNLSNRDKSLQRFVYKEIEPLLIQHQDALKKKTSPFNPKVLSERNLLDDIGKGNWLKLRVGYDLSERYAEVFNKTDPVKIFGALTENSFELDEVIALFFKNATDTSIKMAFSSLLEQAEARKQDDIYPIRLAVFEESFSDRLNEQGASFLFEGASSSKQVIAGINLLSKLGVKATSGAILAKLKNDDLAQDLLEYDLGL